MSAVFDAGALIAFERGARFVVVLVQEIRRSGGSIIVPAGVVGQVWRGGSRQAMLARLLASALVIVEALDDRRSRAAGQLCGQAGTTAVIDASVVIAARLHRLPIVTSDPSDLRRLDARVSLIEV